MKLLSHLEHRMLSACAGLLSRGGVAWTAADDEALESLVLQGRVREERRLGFADSYFVTEQGHEALRLWPTLVARGLAT